MDVRIIIIFLTQASFDLLRLTQSTPQHNLFYLLKVISLKLFYYQTFFETWRD